MRKLVLFAMTLALLQAVSMTTGLGTKKVAADASKAGEFTAQKLPVLLKATRLTVNGTPMGHGACEFVPPKLTLAPNETALEADEVSVNTITCTSVWQIGTPSDLTTPSGPNYSSATQQAAPASRQSAGRIASASTAANLTSSSGYTYAWADASGVTMTSDQSNIAWTWDGSCVSSSSGQANWWWLSEVGWQSPYNNGAWINPYCVWSKVWSQADFKNSSYCHRLPAYTHYRGVSVRGWGNGSMDGWVDSMWIDNGCGLLSHYRVVRTV